MDYIIDKIEKTVKLPFDEKRTKHTFYHISCKLGTAPALLWVLDQYPAEGESVMYIDGNYDMRTFPVTALGPEAFKLGSCDRVNDDGYAFITR